MKPLIWIIDEEWPDYDIERKLLAEAFPGCEIRHSSNDYFDDLESFGKKADAVICQVYVNLPKQAIEKLEKCKIISVYGGGYDRVDLEAAKAKNITVTFVPGYCVDDVSDYVIAAVYFFNKQLDYYLNLKEHVCWGAQAVNDIKPRVNQSTLLIVGFGRIGSAVALKAQQMGMRVIAADPIMTKKMEEAFHVRTVGLEEGLRQADYITLHVKYDESVHHLIGENEFKQMKKSAYLINTTRGKIIDEEKLIKAVEQKEIAGAMLDVVSIEPPVGNEAIFNCKNIYVTQHVSYISTQSLRSLKERAANNVIKVLNGEVASDIAI